jgi:hypothetical protein
MEWKMTRDCARFLLRACNWESQLVFVNSRLNGAIWIRSGVAAAANPRYFARGRRSKNRYFGEA